eukprot:150783-Pleurochrysis_carterae.AAC.1
MRRVSEWSSWRSADEATKALSESDVRVLASCTDDVLLKMVWSVAVSSSRAGEGTRCFSSVVRDCAIRNT